MLKWLVPIAILCTGCSVSSSVTSGPTSSFDTDVFDSPDKVVARRLHHTKKGAGDEKYDGMTPSKQSVSVSAAAAKQLIDSLRRAEKGPQGGKACSPLPGIAVEFTRDKSEGMILLCFECDIFGVVGGNGGGGDFDPERPTLLKWAKSIFPKDQQIQHLPLKG